MCGIFGFTGEVQASPILLKGLSLLEYRGYDSSGMSILNGSIKTIKNVGNIAALKEKIPSMELSGKTGIAHTRWATHGKASEANAHPHLSNSGRFAMVHNGIIENHGHLKALLLSKGFSFYSQTDSEVLVNYLEYLVIFEKLTISKAFSKIHDMCEGEFAVVVLDKHARNTLWITKKGAPLVVGKAPSGLFVSSDVHALENECHEIYFPNDRETVVLKKGQLPLCYDPLLFTKKPEFTTYSARKQKNITLIKSNHFEHITLKEIHEQPAIIKNIIEDQDLFTELDSLQLSGIKRIVLLACGSSLHAALLARQIMEQELRIPVLVEQAAEFAGSNPIMFKTDLAIGISQSGETADTLAACRICLNAGVTTLGITNTPYSTLSRETHGNIFLKAGKEIGVASSKAFTAQIMVFVRFTAFLAKNNIEKTISDIPGAMNQILKNAKVYKNLAFKYKDYQHFLFLGRKHSYPMAMEGALKLKELSYVHAEGYQAGELKHGPLALIDSRFPVLFLAPEKSLFKKNLPTLNEIKSRNARVISIISESFAKEWLEGIQEAEKTTNDYTIVLPDVLEKFSPLLTAVSVQLFAYYMALANQHPVDQPRNLAKSVTVA